MSDKKVRTRRGLGEKLPQAVGVTEILLTKLDSSAKGGIALAISHQLGLPITYTGLGEGLSDLTPFDAQAYVEALLPPPAETPVSR